MNGHGNDAERAGGAPWDHSTHARFYDYYARESQSRKTLERYAAIRELICRVLEHQGRKDASVDVADIGCGAGTQCLLWAEYGHRVRGIDVNEPLVELARERATRAALPIEFQVGSAVQLPWPAESVDVCLVPELLEHVVEWEACLDEFGRILRPRGVLFLSTTNRLCPVQQEFNLPAYSWYPSRLKRRFERLATTTRPELVNYARYPAVNWFSFYSLRAALARRGLDAADRFQTLKLEGRPLPVRWVVRMLRAVPPLRWLAHLGLPSTTLVAIKRDRSAGRPGR